MTRISTPPFDPKGNLLPKRTSGPTPKTPSRRTASRLPRKTNPTLRLSPTAWAKLLFLRDLGETEVGGFGIAAAEDLLGLEDIQLVRQVSTVASVALDDEAVADFFDRQVDLGLSPQRFGRIWVHTHPGTCPQPSSTDQDTFARVFGHTDWAVMFILARGGEAYARLEFHVGPGGGLLLPVEVDFTQPFPAADQTAWHDEYLANVREELPTSLVLGQSPLTPALEDLALCGMPTDDLGLWPEFLPDDLDSFPASIHPHGHDGEFPDDDDY